SDQGVKYYAERAKGGCGLITTEAVAVWKPGYVSYMLQISDDSYIPNFKKLTDAIHAAGGKASIQLWQAGMAAMKTPGSVLVMPSDMPLGPGRMIPGASKETIHAVVKAFGEAAKRAVEAGFDALEYHAAHFYSPHAFLCPATNRREDEYGGSFENRARFLIESIQAIRANMPDDMPLIMRIGALDDDIPNGLTIEDTIRFCKMAKEAGVDVLNISRGNKITKAMRLEVPSLDIPRGFNIENAAKIRKETGMLTIGVGRVNDPDQAEEIIASGKTDMVVIGRAQIADPYFCNKAKEGRKEDILNCVGCNQGCYDNCVYGKPITCLRNPAVGREEEFDQLKKTETPKKVLVVGGGVAGMEAAYMAHKLGHNVTLAEKTDKLGGQFLLAGKAPRKHEMEAAVNKRAAQIVRDGVQVVLNTVVDEEFLESFKPEVVIASHGASPIMPNIEGADGKNVYNFVEVLEGKAKPEGHTVVVGGGLVGLEVAEYVRSNGNEVTVVEMLDSIAKDVGPGRKTDIMLNVIGAGIKPITDAKCTKITENAVTIETKDGVQEIACDSVIIAVGSKPNCSDWIKGYCENNGIICKVVGDAVQARRALDAVHEAVNAVIEL
ncbi:MAG: FAD-dependent oxidoreductase, partial [Erysipelotrichaceae bacterium]|nr:FAD-dependent oxidoreductase [Erysipelotrichaceae bacterium]